MEKFSYMGIGVCLIALLTGCSGGSSSGGGGGGDATSAAGLYLGTITQKTSSGEEITGDSTMLLSLAPDNNGGEFIEQAPGTYASGTISFGSSDTFSGNIEEFQLGRPLAQGTIKGTRTNTSLSGTSYNMEGEELNTFEYLRVPELADISSDLGRVDKTWTDTRTVSPTTTITVAPDGTIDGSDGNCTFNGTVTVPDSEVNLYKLAFTASNCRDWEGYPDSGFSAEEQTGDYEGYSYYAPANKTDPERFVFLADNGKINRYFVFE